MKRLFLFLAAFLLAIDSFAGWIPDLKYANWMPAFALDKTWNLYSGSNNRSNDPMDGCYMSDYPGAICWAMMSWDERTGHWDDHNMQWAEVYIIDYDNQSDQIKLCKVVPEGANDDDGWRQKSLDNNNDAGTTYLAKEVFRSYADGSGFLYYITFYSETVRQFINNVKNKGHRIGVRFYTKWDDNYWNTYDKRSPLDYNDSQMVSPPTPQISNVNWTVHGDKTSVSFRTGNLSEYSNYKFYVSDANGRNAENKEITSGDYYYTPRNLSDNKSQFQGRLGTLSFKGYTEQTYTIDMAYYKDNSMASRTPHTFRSAECEFTTPVFPHPSSLVVNDLYNGNVTVSWSVPSASNASSVDTSSFVLERSTSPNFVSDYQSYTIPYNSSTTNYTYKDTIEFRNRGMAVPFYYRIHRGNSTVDDLGISASTSICTNPAELSSFEAHTDNSTNTVYVTWDFTKGIISNDMFIHVTSQSNSEEQLTVDSNIPVAGNEYRQGGFAITPCEKTTFKAQLCINNNQPYGMEKMSRPVTIQQSNRAVIDTVMASAGYYNDRVVLNWKVNQQHNAFNSFIIYRQEYGTTDTTYYNIGTVTYTSGVLDYTFTDNTCVPGVYYLYCIDGLSYCDGKPVPVGAKLTVGYARSLGVVSGQIIYDGNQASPGVAVVASGEGRFKGKSLRFVSAKRPLLAVPSRFVGEMFGEKSGTVEFFVRLNNTNENCVILRYKDYLYLKCQDGALRLEVKDQSGTTHQVTSNTMENNGLFRHVAITYGTQGSTRNCTLYVDGVSAGTFSYNAGSGYSITQDVAGQLFIGSDSLGSYMNGNIDEIRFWNVERTATQVQQGSNSYLGGTETGLTGYYRCDDDVSGVLFDLSQNSTSYNGRHFITSGITADSVLVPTSEQLCLKTYTDANGHYNFSNIPFSYNGTAYTITPMLGVHEFNPSSRPLYFHSTSVVHNSVDFTDASSFEVSGTVYYYNTNYPAKGCQFYVDGSTPCMKDGELITSDESGNFTISVPIGKHYIKVTNGNHTFANGGRYPATGLHEFDRPMQNLTFNDSTFVLVTGRVAGGSDEEEKPHGFGEGKATIGQARITISPVGAIYDLNRDTANSRTFVMPTDSIKRGSCHSVATAGRAVANYAKYITILTDSATGEFNVMLPPLNYTVNSVNIIHNDGNVFFATYSLPSLDLTQQDVLLRSTDSLKLDSIHRLTFSYAKALDVVYYATPKMRLTQNGRSNTALGSQYKYYYYTNASTGAQVCDTIPLYVANGDSVAYSFGHPCFTKGDVHTWQMTVAEPYVNYDRSQNPDTTWQPFRYGVVTVENNIGTSVKNKYALTDTAIILSNNKMVYATGNELLLDNDGKTYYTFQVGDPSLFAPYTATVQVTYQDADRTRDYNWEGNEELEFIVFGAKTKGTNMITKGPDEIFYVLRDPPGSDSYATWAAGETVTKTKISSKAIQRSGEFDWSFQVGNEFDVISLMPFVNNGICMQFIQTEQSIGPYIEYEGSTKWYNSDTWTFTNEQTVSTSNDHSMVGSCADVYIGKSKNYLIGQADQIDLQRDTAGNYSIGKKEVIALGESLTTQFHYSQDYIEKTLIPNLKQVRNSLLTTVSAAQYNKNYPKQAKTSTYITTLGPSDPRFGEDSTYIQILPQDTTKKLHTDTIHVINQQIKSWINVMKENEQAKVMVHHSTSAFDQSGWEKAVYGTAHKSDELFKAVYAPTMDSTYKVLANVNKNYKGGWLIGNYSVGAGAPFSQSQTRTYSCISNGIAHSNSFIVKLKGSFDFEIKSTGTNISFAAGAGGIFESETSTDNQQTSTVSYNVLMDSYEALSFDVYQAPDGYGPIFCTRAGQTFCPYEDVETTKYYNPGSNLHTATVPMAKPSITAVNNRAVSVPVGQSAYFTITLGNQASTTPQMEFLLCEDVSTNPNGAVIKMDGAPVTYNGLLVGLAGGASTNKVIEITQTRPDILNYDSIRLIFKTNCYKFDADTIYLTAHFVPTCSDINLTVDKTTLNNTTDTTVHFTISGYNPDFINFQGIQLQYQREGDVNWTTLQTWQAASLQGVATLHHNLKFTLPEYPDGTYRFRAVTLCQWGNETINNESDIIPITVDLAAPAALGLPYPLDGIYSNSSQVYVDFSEPIQTGRVLQSNVTVEGVLNSHQIDHSISLDLEKNSAYSSATYLLDSVPFALEMWIKYSTAGTIFSYGASQNNGFVLSIDANHKLVATINGQSVVSDSIIRPDEWCYLLVQCDPAARTLNATYAYGNRTVQLFVDRNISVINVKGNVIFGGNGLKAKIHDVSLWNTTRTWATALAERGVSKSPYTQNLISLWRMDEGKGTKAADCIRHRDLVLSADAWAYNYTNYALHIPARSTASVNISECPILAGQSWLFEFWYRTKGSAHLFHLQNDSIRVGINNGNLTINGQSYSIRNYNDSVWHHLAIICKNTAAPIIAIDGVQLSSYLLVDLPAFAAASVIFGADSAYGGTTHDLDIDEVRLWKVNTTLEMVRQYRNTCLTGTESGLQAYYPMEHTIVDAYNQNVTAFTDLDKTATDTLTAKRITCRDAACHVSTCQISNSSPALIESRPTEYVAHTFTASEDRVVINVTEPDARIEGCTLEFTVKSIVDKNGNYSQPIRWSAYVNRNQLLWDEDVISIVKDELVDTTFNLVIINNGSQTKSWSIDNVPTWMTLSESYGAIQPLQSETLTCTINSSLGRGEDEYTLYLSSDDNIERPLYLETKVYANRPNWTVDPTKYSSSMNLITCAEINGVMADDPEDLVAAYIGNELVGVSNLLLLPEYGRYFAMMTIYPGSDSKNKSIKFRYWDASNGVVYNNIAVYCKSKNNTDSLMSTLDYRADNIYGDINNPYLLRMGTEVEQSNDLRKGWNWISINVAPISAKTEDIWKAYLSYVDILKSQSDFAMADSINDRMIGTLDTMDCYKGYRLKANRKFTAKITGTPVPINSTFTLAANRWTWIGFIPQAAMTVNDALSNINPSKGDIIKSQQQFATWDGSSWVGTLAVMEPGKGYSYKNNGTSSILFSYPDYGAMSYLPARMPAHTVDESHFTPIDEGLYQGNMTMTAIVKLNGEEIEDAEVAVFAGDECRAVSEYLYGYYFLTIPGEESVDMTIKVVYNDSIYSVKEGFTYESDQILGDIYEPYVIDLSGENTSVVSVEADAEGDKVEKVLINNEVFIIRNGEYYDMTGRRREKPQP